MGHILLECQWATSAMTRTNVNKSVAEMSTANIFTFNQHPDGGDGRGTPPGIEPVTLWSCSMFAGSILEADTQVEIIYDVKDCRESNKIIWDTSGRILPRTSNSIE